MSKAICTVITKSYLPAARALFKSIVASNGDMPFYVFLADHPDGFFDPAKEPFKVIPLESLGNAETLHRMTFYYSAFELCNALKAHAHQYLLRQTGAEAWIFLDSDIMVSGSLDPVWRLLDQHSILISPHLLRPAPLDRIDPVETGLLRLGIYNGGFLGFRRGEASASFIDWFLIRLNRFCTNELNVDQRWLSLAPGFFADCAPVELPGFNVAYWNLHERPLQLHGDGKITAAGEPLIFFHFSAWDPKQPQLVSRRAELSDVEANPAWQRLSADYVNLLKSCGLDEAANWPYSFARGSDGRPISYRMRRQYYDDYTAGLFQNDDPFKIAGPLRRRARTTMRKRLLKRVADHLPPGLRKWIV